MNVCDSTRIQCVTVQVGQIPLRIVNLYLKPGASSETNMLNTRLMHHAINAVSNFVGPGLITGDWNHCLDEFDELQSLFVRGWKDVAVEVAGWKNQFPSMTCMGVTRHTFQIANPILSGVLTIVCRKCWTWINMICCPRVFIPRMKSRV